MTDALHETQPDQPVTPQLGKRFLGIDNRRIAILFIGQFKERDFHAIIFVDFCGRDLTVLEAFEEIYKQSEVGIILANLLYSSEVFRRRTRFLLGKPLCIVDPSRIQEIETEPSDEIQ